ncbi:MAG: DUF1559 family PulG-like putative transporter [Limisphaerales bacterium]
MQNTQQTAGVTRRSLLAFTLIELLVVIAIIGILASLILSSLARAKEKAHRAQCMSNLKQVGVAIEVYAQDHGNRLPGPTWQGIYENYDNLVTNRMIFYLATYLGLPAPRADVQTAKILRCPSAAVHWRNADPMTSAMALQRPLSYIASAEITNINSGVVTRPFGYPYKDLPTGYTNITEDQLPRKTSEIYNPSRSWALVDADQQNSVNLAGYYYFQPATPTHGSVRNELFFDWHVESVKTQQ